ncbi:MAG: SDR family oxidoreductase [Spirochaetales bacterium]|nr:SDR family oxidoreductase [Spirochaetales bacterium]
MKEYAYLTRFMKSIKAGKQHTAFITGASSGLGDAYANALAQSGFDLIITARRKEKLEECKKVLEKKHSVSVVTIQADLSKQDDIGRLENEIEKSRNLCMLINNAGFGAMDYFAASPLSKVLDMLHVHVTATTRLCRAAVPVMKKNGTGYIINVSSLMAFMPLAGQVMYSATKSYIVHFSEALQQELQKSSIKVQALCPGFIATNFLKSPEYSESDSEALRMDSITMKPEKVVEESLLALKKRKVIFIPGMKNRLLYHILYNRPGLWLIKKIAGRMMSSIKQE